MQSILLVSLCNIFVIVSAKEYANKMDRYLIACHTTDLTCFKRQHQALRDEVLLGNHLLGIDFYEFFIFSYGDSGTCVKITGVEGSELVGISVNSITKEYKIVIELPVKIQQVLKNASIPCARPDKKFGKIEPQTGGLKKFSGNATVTVSYPFTLRKKKGKVYMSLQDENVDAVLDMPDLRQHDRDSQLESTLYEWSEWAYNMVQHVDVAQHCLVPYTGQLKLVMDRIPLEKFLLLYPEEEYSDLQFSLNIDIPDDE